MKALLDPRIESRADRVTDLAVVAIVVVGLIGIFTAQTEVPLQFDSRGVSNSAPAVIAAAIYSFLGLFVRFIFLRSSHPLVRWVARLLIAILLVFEIAAVIWAS